MWTLGQAERNLGHLAAASATLAEAVGLAAACDDAELVASIRSSFAFVVARQGDLGRALQLLREAESAAVGSEHSRVLGQIGIVMYWRGDLVAAADHLERCCVALAAAGDDELGEARYRNSLGGVLTQLARFDEAMASLERAAHLAETNGLTVVSGAVCHNFGCLASLRGDFAGAIGHFEAAARLFTEGGARNLLARLLDDHAGALAGAGLFGDANALLRAAVELHHEQGQGVEAATALLTEAEIGLARGDLEAARTSAARAAEEFTEQQRPSWVGRARAVGNQAAALLNSAGAADADRLDRSAGELAEHGWVREGVRCALLAARLRAERSLSSAGLDARVRRDAETRGAADRTLLAHIDALVALNHGDRATAREAVSRGLAAASIAQAELGAIETRAHAARYGHDLVELGARLAVADGDPRELLSRVEATRVLASRLPSVRPPTDPEIARLLAELRGVEVELADPATSDERRSALERDRERAERAIRGRSRALRGDGAAVDLDAELEDALRLLGDRQLVAHAALDGRLYAVDVTGGKASLHDLGAVEVARQRVEGVAFALNRLNRAQGSDASRLAAAELLFGLADELAALLLPPVVAESLDPVVVVPTAVLHDVPWGLLPPLGGRAVTVNASLTGWARALTRRAERGGAASRTAGFIAGPGLDYAELEAGALATYYPAARILAGGAATGERCLELFGAVDLAHVACHGSFRRDNPLFSSIHVADGPLNVYDFERLDRLPDTVVLSACSIAGAKALQGGSLLGLGTALTTLGVSTVIAPLTPVSDAASVTVMQRLHQGLVAGMAPAEALAAAALTHDVTDPTAAAFVALGA